MNKLINLTDKEISLSTGITIPAKESIEISGPDLSHTDTFREVQAHVNNGRLMLKQGADAENDPLAVQLESASLTPEVINAALKPDLVAYAESVGIPSDQKADELRSALIAHHCH